MIATIAERHLPHADRIQPREIVTEIERTLKNEVDLQREGANASQLRRNFLDSPDLLVPRVYWDWSSERVLTLERVRGIPSNDLEAVAHAGEQAIEHLVRQHAAVQQRVENRVVQRLHRPVIVALRIPRRIEAARQQQVRQPRDERLEIDLGRQVGDEAGIAISHESVDLMNLWIC